MNKLFKSGNLSILSSKKRKEAELVLPPLKKNDLTRVLNQIVKL